MWKVDCRILERRAQFKRLLYVDESSLIEFGAVPGRSFGTPRGLSFARCGSGELRAWFCALALAVDALRGFLDRCRLELVRAQCSHSFDLLYTSR